MYHAIVRRRARGVFEQLSAGDWERIAGQLAPDVHHVFPGDHPLGGERHTRAAVLRWLERLGRLYPGHDFHIHRVLSRGWPWSTWVVIQWTAQLRPQVGEPYGNAGSHWVRIRWGKATYFHAYLDTERIARSCAAMAAGGVEEAAAPPLVD